MDDLMLNGFVIYPKDDLFCLQKISTPNNPQKINEKVFPNYEAALNFAKSFMQKGLTNYTAVVRYNRGLGVEYKNLSLIEATNIEEAEAKALIAAQDNIQEQHIIGIRVRPKNN